MSSTKVVRHLFSTGRTNGRVQEPHYTDEGYLNGERLENGFETERQQPRHEEVHIGCSYVVHPVGEPHYMRAEHQPSEKTKVIHVGNSLSWGKAEPPHYMQKSSRAKLADAAAEAVRGAVLRGEIDPSELL